MDDGRIAMQYGKPATAHPTSPSMPSPLTPVDGASFYPTATDVDGKAMMLSPRYGADVKPAVVLTGSGSEHPPTVVVSAPTYSQFQLGAPPAAAAAVQSQQPPGSLLADLDDIDALQCQWDMKHFEPGKLTESDLTCLDTPASTTHVSGAPTSVFTAYSTTPLMTPADPPTSFPIFSSPTYHPYYQPQQIFSSEFHLDYSTPEVKEMLCTGWLESDILNVN